MNKIWTGPASTRGVPLWYGLERGASLAGLAATIITNGVTTPSPFPIAASWLGTWLQQNPAWDWKTLTCAQFDRLFAQSVAEFSAVIATDNPDLRAFRDHGGKILIWHGLADQLIFPQGTIQYYQRVQHAMGGPASTDSFARLFLASGAQHAPAPPARPRPTPGRGGELGGTRPPAGRHPGHGHRPGHRRGDPVPATVRLPPGGPLRARRPQTSHATASRQSEAAASIGGITLGDAGGQGERTPSRLWPLGGWRCISADSMPMDRYGLVSACRGRFCRYGRASK